MTENIWQLPKRVVIPIVVLVGFSASIIMSSFSYYYGAKTRWETRSPESEEEFEEEDIGVEKEQWKEGVTGLVGNTPIIEIKSLSALFPGVRIFGKCEFLNPGGSIKDRVALRVLQNAIEERILLPNKDGPRPIAFEGTSGSTGISLTVLAAAVGVGAYIVLPSDIGQDKVQTLRRLGATLEIVKPTSIVDEKHYVNVARKRAEEYLKTGVLPDLATVPSDLDNPLGAESNEEGHGHTLSTTSTYLTANSTSTPPSSGQTIPSFLDSASTSNFPTPALSSLNISDIPLDLKRKKDQNATETRGERVGQGASIFMDQFENPQNFRVHFEETGPEIWKQMKGEIDGFISGMGTGGTMAGVGTYLKSKNKKIEIILADPQGSGLYNKVKHGVLYAPTEAEGTRRRHQVDSIVEGIGLNRSTHNMRLALPIINDAVRVSDHEAVVMSRHLLAHDGLFVGSSSAVNLIGAMRLARRWNAEGKEGNIVTILCDSGSRHFKRFWNDEVVKARKVNVLDTLMNIMDDPEA